MTEPSFTPSQNAASRPDMQAVAEALGFEPDNHHNALRCPYCQGGAGPSREMFAAWLERRGVGYSAESIEFQWALYCHLTGAS